MSTKPAEKLKSMFFMFKEAIDAERDAQALYKKIISLCDDKQLCRIFEGFHNDEVKHEKEIVTQYNQIRKLYPDIDFTNA